MGLKRRERTFREGRIGMGRRWFKGLYLDVQGCHYDMWTNIDDHAASEYEYCTAVDVSLEVFFFRICLSCRYGKGHRCAELL